MPLKAKYLVVKNPIILRSANWGPCPLKIVPLTLH